jgi:hypothetical protein
MSRQKTRISDGRKIKTYDAKSSAEAHSNDDIRLLDECHLGCLRYLFWFVIWLVLLRQLGFPSRFLLHFSLDSGGAYRLRGDRSFRKPNRCDNLQRICQKTRWNLFRIRRDYIQG